jgi:NAD-dependent oxidoreductase involved in siderophore biosynthesis
MKRLLFLLTLAAAAHAAPPASFWTALHQVETSGRLGAILGDNGRSLGPLQISRAYFADSKVAGSYEQVIELDSAIKVASAYMRRYEPEAWRQGNVEILARLHNAGPSWRRKLAATDAYAAKVQREMRKLLP